MAGEKKNKTDKPKQGDHKEDKQMPLQGRRLSQTIIWIILAAMAAYIVFRDTGQKDRINISYSKFKQEVRTDNVQKVVIKGQHIKGEFKAVRVSPADTSRSAKYFNTTMPSLEDKGLLGLLEEHAVTIEAQEEDGGWWQILLYFFLPWLFIIGLFTMMRMRQQRGGSGGMMQGIFGIGKSRARRFQSDEAEETFDDVAGLESAKRDLKEIVDYLQKPEKFAGLGARIPKGILLVGPPGTGKTLLARAVAGEAKVKFFSISGSEFIEMFVGVGASRVRDMFANAKKEAPSIIFIDELDSVGRSRGTGLGGGHDEREQTLNQILSEMDGFEPYDSVVVIAATNRPDVLDMALVRPGRFDRQVKLDLPQREARQKILEIHTRKVPLSGKVDLENMAARTVGFSGADLRNLVNEAALLTGRREKQKVGPQEFDDARDKIILGAKRDDMMSDEDKKIVAYHESGHALVAHLTKGADPLQKVTIIPRGRALGVTEQIPEEERYNISRNYLKNRLSVIFGGRAAEKLVFSDMTTGAGNDLKEATKLAKRMITQWGMSEKIGPRTVNQNEDHPFLGREIVQNRDYSEETSKLIDEEVKRILEEAENQSSQTLKDNRKKLDKLAEALLEEETLDADQIAKILDK